VPRVPDAKLAVPREKTKNIYSAMKNRSPEKMIGRPIFKKISQRPSKTYFYNKFLADIDRYSDCKIAADIASARFDNTEFFRSEYYLGVDFDKERLQTGRDRYQNERSRIAIQADVRNQIFKEESLEVVACSHTLSHLDSKDVFPTVRLLIRYLVGSWIADFEFPR
jgi:hypothetical protein